MRKEFKLTFSAAALALMPLQAAFAFPVTAEDAASSPGVTAVVATSSIAPAAAAEETKTIQGTVVDKNNGEPLIGATVMLKGVTGVGAVTDIDGHFTLKYPAKKNAMLTVSYIGYQSKDVPIQGLSEINIELDPSEQSLNEVVVTGTGVQKKVSVTGAISSVSGSQLQLSSSTLSQNLAGKFAGVYANNTTGEPGSGAEFYIRGISNFAGKSATPLILLDDVEISSSDLNKIPSENIKSFSVLKDASATAIYGARGANGVMIITTKGGDYNTKTNINVKVENTFNFMGQLPEFVNGGDFMELYNQAAASRNPGITPRFSEERIERTRTHLNPYLYPDVDWQKTLFRKMAMRQRANVNLSGGGSKVKYYMAIDFLHEDGHYKTEKLYSWNNQLQNYVYNFQNNISYKVTPTTTISMNLNAQIAQKAQPNVNSNTFFSSVIDRNPVDFAPVYPARDGYDYIIYGCYDKGGNQYSANPYQQMRTSYWQYNENVVNTVVKINQDLEMITKGLSFNAWVNFKNWAASSYTRSVEPYKYYVTTYDVEDWQNPIFDISLGTYGSKYINQSGISKWTDNTFELQANVNWVRDFNDHEINAVVLYRMREYRNSVLPNRNQGVSGRVTYDYGHKYLAEFNFGYNGTERLSKGYRFGFFPAGSIGWVPSQESFWEPISPVISYFKVRGSLGLVGSDNLAPAGSDLYFFYYDQIMKDSDGNFKLDYLQWSPGAGGSLGWAGAAGGPQMAYYGLPTLGWEKVRKLDIGVDFRFFDDINLTLDYFFDHRYDILLERASWPGSLGYGPATPYGPVGVIDNKGFEGSLTYTKALTPDLSISFNGNFTYNKNTLVDADELNYKYPWLFSTGLPLDYTRGYIAEGLFQSQEEIDNSPIQNLGSNVMVGDIKYRDLNGDGQINSDDQTMISKYGKTPRIQYGFGATLNYKKWDFGFFFTGSGKRTLLVNNMDPFVTYYNEIHNCLAWVADNYFDPSNPDFNAKYPRLGIMPGEIANNQVASSYWTRDGSFLRLRNLELGWTFPLGRVYVQGNNLLNFTSFKFWDPEMESWYKYPTQRSVTVGVQFNL